jgi:signal transduction histidine kinase
MSRRSVGLRAQLLMIVLGGAILPLALVGLWLTSSAVRSGEALLRSHLEESADRFAAAARGRWEYRRADVALLAENDASVRAVTRPKISEEDLAFLESLASSVSRTIPSVELRDTHGELRWASTPSLRAAEARARGEAPVPQAAQPALRLENPINDGEGKRVGMAITSIALSALVPSDSARPVVPGGHVAIRDWRNNNVLLPFTSPGSPERYLDGDRATVDGATWFVAHRRLAEPTLEIAVAAPVAPYTTPFGAAARLGVIALLVVAALAMLLTVALATRATRPLEELARASAAVTAGKLDQQVGVRGPTEVQQVGAAFNAMTAELRTTLDALSRRSALAAVGEFATSLSHDVRNALTSIKVDLDRLSLRDIPDPAAQGLIHRALNSVARLEASVAGALRVARRGHAPFAMVDLRTPIREAAETVGGTLAAIPATLDAALPTEPILVRGDAQALEQLFANLLFNAAQALAPGGRARISAETNGAFVDVAVADTGVGISEADMARLATPFFSSKASGTGLGLPIARQIVAAHGGELSIESTAGAGTTVRVRLPIGTNHSTVLNGSAHEHAAAG